MEQALPVTYGDMLTLLLIVAAVLLIIVLYHLMFAAYNLRRISAKVRSLSDEFENVARKPLEAMNFMIDWLAEKAREFADRKRHGKKGKKEKAFVETEVR